MSSVGATALYEDVESVNKKDFDMHQNECYGSTATPSGIILPQSNESKPVESDTQLVKKKTSVSRFIVRAVWIWRVCITFLVVVALAMAIWSLRTAEKSVCKCVDKSDSSMEINVPTSPVPSTNMPANTKSTTKILSSTNMPTNTEILSDTTVDTATMTPTSIPTAESTISSHIIEKGMITLNNVSLYMDCNTNIEQTCDILPIFGDTQCTTIIGHTYLNPGDFIMDISCVRVNSTTEQNGLSFVLAIDEARNEVECYCYTVQLVGGVTLSRAPVRCGLRVTRCRTLTSINSTYTLTP